MMVTTMDNATYSWGSNRYGNLGLGNTTSYLTPQRINGFRRSNPCVRFMSSSGRPWPRRRSTVVSSLQRPCCLTLLSVSNTA